MLPPATALPPARSARVQALAPGGRDLDTFQQECNECFQAKYGYWRPVVECSMTARRRRDDLQEGFARVRCPECHHEVFVGFSCKQRRTYPACRQKCALLTSIHVAEDICTSLRPCPSFI